jgi:hypothetical protein
MRGRLSFYDRDFEVLLMLRYSKVSFFFLAFFIIKIKIN